MVVGAQSFLTDSFDSWRKPLSIGKSSRNPESYQRIPDFLITFVG